MKINTFIFEFARVQILFIRFSMLRVAINEKPLNFIRLFICI